MKAVSVSVIVSITIVVVAVVVTITVEFPSSKFRAINFFEGFIEGPSMVVVVRTLSWPIVVIVILPIVVLVVGRIDLDLSSSKRCFSIVVEFHHSLELKKNNK